MATVGVILSGCGVMDGSEIHEAVLALLYLDRAGAKVECYAPDKPQMHVVNHLTGRPVEESRNVLVEAARIARGDIHPLSLLHVDAVDAVVLPGGYGAAKNLCTFATAGVGCELDADVARVLREAHAKKKVIGAICISPVLVARALQETSAHPLLTIGSDAATAGAIRAMGGENRPVSVSEIVVDEANRIVTTPAYMLGPTISKVAQGIEKLIEKVLVLAGN